MGKPACTHVAPYSASTLHAWACAPQALTMGRWQRSGGPPVAFAGRAYTSKRAAAGLNMHTALATKVEGSARTGLVLKAKAAQSNVARSRLAAATGVIRTRRTDRAAGSAPG